MGLQITVKKAIRDRKKKRGGDELADVERSGQCISWDRIYGGKVTHTAGGSLDSPVVCEHHPFSHPHQILLPKELVPDWQSMHCGQGRGEEISLCVGGGGCQYRRRPPATHPVHNAGLVQQQQHLESCINVFKQLN